MFNNYVNDSADHWAIGKNDQFFLLQVGNEHEQIRICLPRKDAENLYFLLEDLLNK